MKRITLGFLLFFTQFIFAQFTANDVRFYVGTGNQTAYLVVDFKDGTDDRSYAWGYRFNTLDKVTMGGILVAVANAEPNFTINPTSGTGFLSDVIFNSHSGLDSQPDWWSTWAGSSADTFSMNGGLSSVVQNGGWYGLSYGFNNPTTEAPVTPIPAYSSQWYSKNDITTWLGTGVNQSLIVIDFGTDTANVADSYVFGIKYDGTITAEDALDLIAKEVTGFDYVMNTNVLSSVTIGSRTETAIANNTWKTYKGTDLSNWKTENNFSQTSLTNNEWLGLSIGSRRPFTPQEITSSLSVGKITTVDFSVYPNPANDVLNIQTNETIKQVIIYNMQGRKLIQDASSVLNIASLSSGIYLVELQTTNGTSSVKFIKK